MNLGRRGTWHVRSADGYNQPMHARCSRSPFLLALAWLVLSGCAGGEDVTPRSLERARQTWKRSRIEDYDLEWTSTGARSGHYLVTVRDGRVREVRLVRPDGEQVVAHPGDPSYYGVEGLFRILREEADQLLEERPFNMPKESKVLLKFTPDPKLGYPRSYRRDVVGSREGLAIDVLRLEPVPADAAH